MIHIIGKRKHQATSERSFRHKGSEILILPQFRFDHKIVFQLRFEEGKYIVQAVVDHIEHQKVVF